ncbi:HugZ family protein [Patulibacter sp.]|uniref:HugZ family pyridoxamine 5'-phosphate oxidase n=1 Tax=Patulibacter sp. TaxID=1912859 RepID=UPI00271845E6|nr:pyridoxamine 5'-phosphate oxidase family protein [Patulibacter sp.]MDO9408826.1 pyridoxamine 5'-phosphate oxidase family protein [Patulibacter sp.]
MSENETSTPTEHGAPPAGSPIVPDPSGPVLAPARRSTAAEEARTMVASTAQGVLASLTSTGDPWGSVVTYGALDDGSPVFLVSRMAEHTRNLEGDERASLVVAEPPNDENPLDRGRVTLAGRVHRPTGEDLAAARAAHLRAMPSAELYADFDDFLFFVLRVGRVRWVGGYGRMDSATAEDYAAARPDPVAPHAAGAVAHLNDDHPHNLLEIARALAGFPDATAASAVRADRHGMDLAVETPRGTAWPRVGWTTSIDDAGGLRAASVDLVRRAREAA